MTANRGEVLQIRIYTLGRFEWAVGGLGVRNSAQRPQRPLELLQAIVALGKPAVHHQVLIDHLWPEAHSKAGRGALETALHRLRRILQCDHAIRFEGGRVWLDRDACWVDAHALSQLIETAEPGDEPATDDALALYRGDFLAGEPEAAWWLWKRDTLRTRFARWIALAGQRLEAAGDGERAERLYWRAVEVMPAAEGIYRRLMALYATYGDLGAAIDVYDSCRGALMYHLATVPTAETEAIRQSLADGRPRAFAATRGMAINRQVGAERH